MNISKLIIKTHLIFVFFLISMIVMSCGKKSVITIKSTNFDKEIASTQNLVFKFNKDIITDTTQLNTWDTTHYISFSPAIPGKFLWSAKNELTFSPLTPFPEATKFKYNLTKELLKHVSNEFKVDGKEKSFNTPAAILETTESYWSVDDFNNQNFEIHIMLKFNNIISLKEFNKFLKINVADKEQEYRIVTNEPDNIVEVAFSYNPEDAKSKKNIKITVLKGLASAGGSLVSEKDKVVETFIPPIDNVEIMNTETGFDKGKGFVRIFTAQPIVTKGIENLINIIPQLNFEVIPLANGIEIKADFKPSESYTIAISKGLTNIFGSEMEDDFSTVISFAEPLPSINFIDKQSMYLSSKGERNLGVRIVNIQEITLSVFKIFENNIQQYIRNGKGWDYFYDEETDEYNYSNNWAFDETYGRPVFTKTIKVRSLQQQDGICLLNLDLDELKFFEKYKGLYLIKVEDVQKKYLSDVQLVSLSDLGLIAKQGQNSIMVFVNELTTTQPAKSVTIDFISSNNQKVYSITTDNQGIAMLDDLKQKAAGFNINMISARLGDDYNYILFDKTKVETSRFDVGGNRINNSNLDVFIYGDRDLYRPGDSVHFNTIVRTTKWEVPENMPIKVKIISPNGKEIINRKYSLNPSGAVSSDVYIPNDALTGVYTIEIQTLNNILLGTRYISVEEFVPDRIKVITNTDKTTYASNENIILDIKAENLYGTPAANRKYEAEIKYNKQVFSPKSYINYNFDIQSKDAPEVFTRELKQGTTNADGTAKVDFKALPFKNIGLIRADVFTTVFDETGRPVNRLNTLELLTQNVFYGIKYFDSWVEANRPLQFRFIAVDKNGQALSAQKAKVEISQIVYETVMERQGRYYNYVSQKKDKVIFSKTITLDKQGGLLNFSPPISGEYQIRIMSPESDNFVTSSFYAYSMGSTNYSSFEVNREGEIEITSDKEEYKPGEKAKLLFRAPFDGKLLVTVEKENVVTHKYLTLKDKTASIDLPVDNSWMPNAYISATAFHKVSDNFMPLTVAHGVMPIKVDNSKYKLNLEISAPEKSKSNVQQTVTVKTQPNTEVTIAVVDEGILQITDFKTPNPFEYFYRKRALGVMSYNIYGLLFTEIKKSNSAGGEAFNLSKRINPLTSSRVQLISKWSGILKTNSSGVCSYTFDIPQFSGAVRVMAVAYKNNLFVSEQKTIRIADPVIISAAVPRFLSPEDETVVAVTLTNTTEKTINSDININVEGTLSVIGDKSKKVSLKNNVEEVVTFTVKAKPEYGQGKITCSLKNNGAQYSQTISLPIRPATTYSAISESGEIEAGKSVNIVPKSNFMAGSAESKLIVSNSPIVKLGKSFDYLIRYPYGCTEQTISCAFPQLYLSDIFELMSNGTHSTKSINNNIQQAIVKIQSNQLYNGGLSSWSQGSRADWWTTAYAAHFLIEAKKAGFEVNEKVLSGMFNFLKQKVNERPEDTYYYMENGVSKKTLTPSPEIFYSLYVLALNNTPLVSSMNYYKSIVKQLAPESKYLLASAFLLSGDNKTFNQILPESFGNMRSETIFGASYSSYIRNISIAMNALLEANYNQPQIGRLAKEVSEEINKTNYLSPQEASFALLALGKFSKNTAKSDIRAKINIISGKSYDYKNENLIINDLFVNKQIDISTKGKGLLYYYYELRGIPLNVTKGDKDNGIQVRRKFLNRNGQAVNSNKFNQNDLVYVEITVLSPQGKTIDNVVITDILPACFEIENTRLTADRQPDFIKNQSTPTFTDIRDDRINIFTNIYENQQKFYYTVRAVSKGKFTVGNIYAEAMYNARYNSYSGASTIEVE